MLYRKNGEKTLSKELFMHPTSEYRGTPFWSWNCRVTKDLIKEQMDVFKQMGFGGAHLHPRTGLENEYMSDEFLDLIRYADDEAKAREMLCWLYDEDRYPSGAAGGLVTENWEYRARHLLLSREKKEGMAPDKKTFMERVAQGEKPAGYYLCAYRIKTKDGYLVSYRQIDCHIDRNQPFMDSACETEREGRLWFAYIELMHESPWFNDQTYIDVMNKEAVCRFLEVTHERYYEALGDEFGKSIPAIFTDEPQMKGSMALADGESEADVTLSFTDDFSETYESQYGVSLLSVLPELLWELPDGQQSVHRYQYHDHLTERFVNAYSDTIADWCEAHNLALTGHYMSEPTLYSQTLRLGEAMRCYRRQQLPGIDILCGDPEYSTAKQASSVARQYGREGVLSELYGVTHWDFDFKGHKLQGDWQAALGVTIRVPHLAFMSMEGEAKRDWPASINYQSPWWKHYAYVEDYFARVNTALTRGKAKVSVGVIHPIESYWLCYGPVAQTGALREQMDENFKNMIHWLLFGLIDFDFLSESLLPIQKTTVKEKEAVFSEAVFSEAILSEAVLSVGQMEYHTVLVPGLKTIRSSTLVYLEQLARVGGQVIFMGEIPSFVDGVRSNRAYELAKRVTVIPYEQHELLKSLEQNRLLEIRFENGKRSDNLFYQMREDGEDAWLFICHVNRKRNRIDQAERMCIRIRGEYELTCYDAQTGMITPQKSTCKNGWTEVVADWYAEDSILWKLTKAVSTLPSEAMADMIKEDCYPVREGKTKAFYGLVAGTIGTPRTMPKMIQTIYEPDGYELKEPNVLLLDQAEWKLDNLNWHPKEEILRLDNEIRTLCGYPHRQDAYTQPWRIKHAPKEHLVSLRYEILSEIDTGEIRLAMERPQDAMIFLNGQICDIANITKEDWYVDRGIQVVNLGELHAGINELRLEIAYGRKTNLENMFLLGEFGVEVRGTRAVVTSPLERLFFGDITRQKLPFYGGSVGYRMHFVLEKTQDISIRVPHFVSPVLEVAVDQKQKGLIAYAPHLLRVGELEEGEHELTICAYGNRFNSFGTLHNCNDEYKWYGPDSYRTKAGEWSEAWCLRPFGILSRVEIIETI